MRWPLGALISFALVACRFDLSPEDEAPLGNLRTIRGTVVDYETGQAIAGAATLSTSGLLPAPAIETQGASFTIEGVPDNSAFQLLASSTGHRPSFSEAVIVGTEDVHGVRAEVVSEAFLSGLATAF